MRIIKPSFEIINPKSEEEILLQLENATRTCYKSDDKIEPGSAAKIVRAVLKSGHYSTIEHFSISVKIICDRGVMAELWWRTKDFFSDGDCSLADKQVFRKLGTELSTPKYGYTTSGKIQIEGKKDLTKRGIKSPNLADAFCLTFSNAGFFGGVI